MEILGCLLISIVGIIQLITGIIGLKYALGTVAAGLVIFLGFALRLYLPLTIGTYICAAYVWEWSWPLALLLAAPGLVFLIPSVALSIGELTGGLRLRSSKMRFVVLGIAAITLFVILAEYARKHSGPDIIKKEITQNEVTDKSVEKTSRTEQSTTAKSETKYVIDGHTITILPPPHMEKVASPPSSKAIVYYANKNGFVTLMEGNETTRQDFIDLKTEVSEVVYSGDDASDNAYQGFDFKKEFESEGVLVVSFAPQGFDTPISRIFEAYVFVPPVSIIVRSAGNTSTAYGRNSDFLVSWCEDIISRNKTNARIDPKNLETTSQQ